jgi:hypothetical protein
MTPELKNWTSTSNRAVIGETKTPEIKENTKILNTIYYGTSKKIQY